MLHLLLPVCSSLALNACSLVCRRMKRRRTSQGCLWQEQHTYEPQQGRQAGQQSMSGNTTYTSVDGGCEQDVSHECGQLQTYRPPPWSLHVICRKRSFQRWVRWRMFHEESAEGLSYAVIGCHMLPFWSPHCLVQCMQVQCMHADAGMSCNQSGLECKGSSPVTPSAYSSTCAAAAATPCVRRQVPRHHLRELQLHLQGTCGAANACCNTKRAITLLPCKKSLLEVLHISVSNRFYCVD